MPTKISTMAEPYTMRWHEDHMDDHLHELVEAVEGWMSRDRENPNDVSKWAGRLELAMRSISADAGGIKRLNNERFWRSR